MHARVIPADPIDFVDIADGKCQVYIETRSNVLWARWFDVWEAVEATVAVCVRKGKWGWSSVKSEL